MHVRVTKICPNAYNMHKGDSKVINLRIPLLLPIANTHQKGEKRGEKISQQVSGGQTTHTEQARLEQAAASHY